MITLSVKIKILKSVYMDNYKQRFTKIQNEKEFRSQSKPTVSSSIFMGPFTK